MSTPLRLLITGASGFIGERIARLARQQGFDVVLGLRRPVDFLDDFPSVPLDLAQPDTLAGALDAAFASARSPSQPLAILHAGAMRDPASCEREPARAVTVNVEATRALAGWAGQHHARLIFCSTDQVFDGTRPLSREADPRRPVNHYGATKALAEDAVWSLAPNTGIVARVALTLGHSREGTRSPNEFVVNHLRAGTSATLFENEFRTPAHVDDIAQALLELTSAPHLPTIHLAGPQRVNRVQMGLAIARAYGLDPALCTPARHDARASGVIRPLDTSMDAALARTLLTSRLRPLDEVATALARQVC